MSDDLERLADLIAASPHNLVARADHPVLRTVHVREAEELATLLDPRPGSLWMDLGTGGGLPGLVLARAHPQATWRLVDARRKKADEVQRFAAELGIACEVVADRAELLARQPEHRGAYEGVVARAVAPLRSLVELVRPLLTPAGRCWAIKGERWEDEIDEAQRALRELGMDVEHVQPLARGGLLVLATTGEAPPSWVPRPPGRAQRDPL